MKDETKKWLDFAGENLESSRVLYQSHLYNPCLQNVQQAVEKSLKAILIERGEKLKRTHDILELKYILRKIGVEINLSEENCDFLNSIYLPSKYPIGCALPDFEPNEQICCEAIKIAESVVKSVLDICKSSR